MLFSVQTPWRGSQEDYERFAAALEAQSFRDFEWIVANDCYDMDPIKPIKTKFPHRIVRIPKRPPGWAYSIARNVCIDFGSNNAQYLAYVDGDVLLFKNALYRAARWVAPNVTIHGWKHYFTKQGEFIKRQKKREVMVLPYDVVRASGGFEELYFPWYGHSYLDFFRRMKKLRRLREVWSEGYAGRSVKSRIKFDRDSTVSKEITKRLKKHDSKRPILRRSVPAELVWQYGY